ncbi:MAG: FkbM family methyltransferase [Candidatus Latescibacterota bacterium]|nr:MAG: FkbM family methyltransferase [Candidatus Latescibacterota bacterium]
MTQDFTAALLNQFAENAYNLHGTDNCDTELSRKPRRSLATAVAIRANRILDRFGLRLVSWRTSDLEGFLKAYGHGLSRLYDLLDDQHSKDLLARIMAFHLLGRRKVKLPIATQGYWKKKEAVVSAIVGRDTLQTDHVRPLNLFELSRFGYPIRLFSTPVGVLSLFVLKQYVYELSTPAVRVEAGDYVIDGGGGWGDAALRFAHETGEGGRVYTFEFSPGNLEASRKNLAFNPELASRVKVIDKPLWNEAGVRLAFSPAGPLTHVSGIQSTNSPYESTSVSIDALVQRQEIPQVDFIKLDVEGAELRALKGAEKTIRERRPKLAVCLYHSMDDFVNIPDYLSSLDTPYRFYLGHYSLTTSETVLFGVPANTRRSEPHNEISVTDG